MQAEGRQQASTALQNGADAGYSTPAFALIRFHTRGRSANSIGARAIFVVLHFLQEGRHNSALQSVRKGEEVSQSYWNVGMTKRT